MTAVEKFAVCKALFDSQVSYSAPLVVHQYRMTVNAVAGAVCPSPAENRAFRDLCERDNWLNDNPFRDD